MAEDPLSLISDPFAAPPVGAARPGELGATAPPTSLISPLGEIDRLDDAARRAPATSPDQAARILRQQRRTGFPLDVITRNLDAIEQQTSALDFDAEKFRADSPLLARWLADNPQHLALAQDDLRPLSAIEQTLRFGENAVRAFAAGALQFNRGFWGLVRSAGELTGVDAVTRLGVQGGAGATTMADQVRGSQAGTGPHERSVYSGFESLGLTATALPFALSGGGTPALLGVLGGAAGGQSYAEAREAGVGVPQAALFGLSQAAIEVATEKIPARWLLGDLNRHAGFLTTLLRQGVAEIPGEQVATVLQDLNAWAVIHPDQPFAAYLEERPSAAAATLIATLVAVGGQTSIASALDRVTKGPPAQRVFEELGAAARASKTLQRSPEDVRAFVDGATAGGPLTTVHLPVDTFTAYMQSQQLDPAEMAEAFTGDPRAYAQALQTGEDLALPMSAYLAQVATSAHQAFFKDEARLGPEALNAREERALEQDVAAQLATIAPEEPSASAGQVRDAVLTLLEQAAVDPATAATYAAVYEELFQTIGTRADLDPVALFERFGLQVRRDGVTPEPGAAPAPAVPAVADVPPGDVPASFGRPGESAPQREQRRRGQWAEVLAAVLRDATATDPTVDPQIIRAEFVARRERFEEGEQLTRESGRDPVDLLRAIAGYGGLWHEASGAYEGEINVLKESNSAPDLWAGVKGVFRKAGLSPDGMVEALRQDPRFAWIETINDLLDAVDAAVRQPPTPDMMPGSADLADALGIRLGSAWWQQARRTPGAEFGDDETAFFQDDDPPRGWDTIEPGATPTAGRRGRRAKAKGTFTPGANVIRLFAGANLSTLLHESGHFYLEVLADVVEQLAARDAATLTETQRRMVADFEGLLQWFGYAGDVAAWRAQTAEQRRDNHEQFARGFEAYLFEGRAPSPALRTVFARTRAWLVSVYRSVRRLHVTLTPEVRGVLDRLLATDDAIAAAQQDLQLVPLFTDAVADAAGLSVADRAALRETMQTASDHARDTLQAKLLADLQRERAAWWKEERSKLRADFAREIGAAPVYRALALLQRGTQADGTPLPVGTDPFKLSQTLLVEQFGDGVLTRLPRPLVYTKRDGVPPSVAAELLGFPSGAALVHALVKAPPIAEAIDQATDAEMRNRHGDLLLDGLITEFARQAVLEAGADLFDAELKALAAAATRQPGGRRVTVSPVSTLRAIAERRIASTPIRDVRPAAFAAAAKRASQQAVTAAGRQNFVGALHAKQQQVLNAELYRAAVAARATVEHGIAGFKALFGPDAKFAQRYNLDLVNAGRSLLSQFQLAPPAQGAAAHVYLDQVKKYDPTLYDDLEAAIEAAKQPARPYQELTIDEFIALRDAVGNLFHLARRSKQMVIDGRARDLEEVRAELEARLQAIGTPHGRRGYARAITKWEKQKLVLMGWRAKLRRVESWVDAIDSGDAQGPFRRNLFTPISEASARYRVAKKTALEQYLVLVKAVEPSLTSFDIPAPEIGYTFSGKGELLHALLHTGNPSNRSKLLRGRNWAHHGTDGSLDASGWDAFVQRLWRDGTLTKRDYDYAQGVWDLNESLKPEAQRVMHEVYGFYMAEITAEPVVTPFGTYRGGYMPAVVDPDIVTEGAQRADQAALEQTGNSYMFPDTGRGWSKGRIEEYARPLSLDLRIVPAHLDQVLRFVYLQPSVRDAARLVIHRGFKRSLDAFDPTVAGELLLPWLQRAAKQTVAESAQGFGGRGADRFWRALRSRTGLNLMAANVVNALQQVTGLSLAALKVPPTALARAFWRYLRAPAVVARAVAEQSVFMATRTTTQTIEVQQHIDDLLLNPSRFESLRAFAQKHGYIFQAGAQAIVDVITWSGAYDHAVAEGATEAEAVRVADSAVRVTQGSFNPEDLSVFETGSPFMRAFTMFYSYYNNKANLLGSEFAMTIRDQGLRQGAGRLLYVYLFGHLIESVVGGFVVDALWQRLPWDDEDEDGSVLDGWLAWFFGNQMRSVLALPPGGTVVNALYNTFATTERYDDQISTSPAIRAIEDSVRAPKEVYDAIFHDGRKKTAIRDTLTAIGLLTGIPVAAVGRPLGYLADVAEGEIEPTGPVDVVRGLVVGR